MSNANAPIQNRIWWLRRGLWLIVLTVLSLYAAQPGRASVAALAAKLPTPNSTINGDGAALDASSEVGVDAKLLKVKSHTAPLWLRKLKAAAKKKPVVKRRSVRPLKRSAPARSGLARRGTKLRSTTNGRRGLTSRKLTKPNRFRGTRRFGNRNGSRALGVKKPRRATPTIIYPGIAAPRGRLPITRNPIYPGANPQTTPGGSAGNGVGPGPWLQPGTTAGGHGTGPRGNGLVSNPPTRRPGLGIGTAGLPPNGRRPPPGSKNPQRNPGQTADRPAGPGTVPPMTVYPPATQNWPDRGRAGVTSTPQQAQPGPRRPRLHRPSSPPPRAIVPTRRAPPTGEPLYREREVIVLVDDAARAGAVQALAAANNLQIRRIVRSKLLGQSMVRFSYGDNRRVESVVRTLRRDPRVSGVQPNFIYRMRPVATRANPGALPMAPMRNKKAMGGKGGQSKSFAQRSANKNKLSNSLNSAAQSQSGKVMASESPEIASPESDGPSVGSPADGAALPAARKSWFNPSIQYGLVKVGAARAHDRATGRRVKIAVIDTAIDKAHPTLTGAVVGSYNALDDQPNARPLAHGTSIAGIIAGRNQISGVAPNAQILEIIAFDRRQAGRAPESSSFSLLRGIEWAFDQGARVFNMSFSGPHDASLARIINSAYAKGAIMTAAAGNGGAGAAPSFPAAYRNVIAVTATDAQDHLYAKANQGGYVTLAAPGVEILTPTLQGGFSYSSGTSFAAAHVSGVIALLLDIDPSLKERIVRRAITQSARDLGPLGRDPKFGAGLVDANLAMQLLRSGEN